MADRTFYQLVLPAELPRDAVKAAAEAFCDDEPWTDAELEDHAVVTINGEIRVEIEERTVGEARWWAEAVHAALTDAGQLVAFWVSEAPYFELGTLVRFDPALGWHQVECDSGLQPLLRADAFAQVVAAAESPAAAIEELSKLFGTAW